MGTVTIDGILGFLGSIIGVIGAFWVASWQNNASERNKALLELHKMIIIIEALGKETYGTNDNNTYDGPMDIYNLYILPLENSRDFLMQNYPIINRKLSSKIEILSNEISNYRYITGGIILNHNETEKVKTDGKKIMLQAYSFGMNEEFVNQEKRMKIIIKEIDKQIKNPFGGLDIPFRKKKNLEIK